MKIAIVVTSPQIGGTEKRFVNLFNSLIENSRNEYFLLIPEILYKKYKKAKLLNNKSRKIIVLFTKFPNNLYNLRKIFIFKIKGIELILKISLRRELYNKLKEINPDLLHFTMGSKFLNTKYGKPILFEAQSFSYKGPFNSKLHLNGLNEGHYFNCASKKIFDNYSSVKTIYSEKKKIFLNPCSFTDYSKTYATDKKKIIIFLGRFEEIKNPMLFLESILELSRYRNDFKALMLGYGSLEKKIKEFITRQKMNSYCEVFFSANPIPLLAKSLIFTSLQTNDNFHSQALMEAMACGCVPVVTNVGESYRLVDPSVGVLVKEDKFIISTVLNDLLDSFTEAVEMGKRAGIKVKSEQNIDTYISYLLSIYEHIIKDWEGK